MKSINIKIIIILLFSGPGIRGDILELQSGFRLTGTFMGEANGKVSFLTDAGIQQFDSNTVKKLDLSLAGIPACYKLRGQFLSRCGATLRSWYDNQLQLALDSASRKQLNRELTAFSKISLRPGLGQNIFKGVERIEGKGTLRLRSGRLLSGPMSGSSSKGEITIHTRGGTYHIDADSIENITLFPVREEGAPLGLLWGGLIPGFRQIQAGRLSYGGSMLGLFALSTAAAAYGYSAADKANKSSQSDLTTLLLYNRSHRQDFESSLQVAQVGGGLASAIFLWNLVENMWSGQTQAPPKNRNAQLDLFYRTIPEPFSMDSVRTEIGLTAHF